MSFPEKCSFVPPRVYGGSLQRASSSAGEMSVKRGTNQYNMNLKKEQIYSPTYPLFYLSQFSFISNNVLLVMQGLVVNVTGEDEYSSLHWKCKV